MSNPAGKFFLATLIIMYHSLNYKSWDTNLFLVAACSNTCMAFFCSPCSNKYLGDSGMIGKNIKSDNIGKAEMPSNHRQPREGITALKENNVNKRFYKDCGNFNE
jgi:hypothetical protein